MEPISFDGPTNPFPSSNKPQNSNVASRSRWTNMPIFKFKRSPKQMSVKTLVMEPVGPDGQTNPFSSTNDLQSSNGTSWSRWANGTIFKFKRAPKQINFCQNFSWTSVNTQVIELVDPDE
ncbi:hypothetical protein H5410_051858 [Solanum commersonii]|uniref:Uncharacterized protein n=1 Tax=Solanum commersonii TaxID=4109 RepID=A0A9J5X0M9_SOLCO|nr:hypothetical protein H5410_051858 [Solanum commersonii]